MSENRNGVVPKNQEGYTVLSAGETVVSPLKLKQEWYDNGWQIIWVEVWNEFTGQYFPRFELYEYPLNTGNYEAIDILMSHTFRPHVLYRVINKLAKQMGVANNFRELRQKAG